MKKKKVLIAVLAILGIVLTTTGITVAWFTYAKNGTRENTITSGSIKFHYQESNTIIDVDDMMPMTDDQGKAQTDYFDFTITASASRTVDIPYYITVRRTDGSYADLDSVVKVYLTKVTGEGQNEVETQVALSKFSSLSHYTNSVINIPQTEKSLYHDTALAGTTNYTQKYRLRIWADTDANYLVQTPVEAYCEDNSTHQPVEVTEANCTGENYIWHPATTADTYPLNNKTYSLKVNVYGEGNDIGESEKATRENTNISSMMIGTNSVTTTDGENYNTTITVTNTNQIPTTITINTENPNATVNVEKLTALGEVKKESGIRRLSTQSLLNLEMGTNNFRITITSADKTKTDIYNLTVVVELKQPESFATDDWETILLAVKNNNTSLYSIGDTKVITLSGFGNHTVRLVNKSECTNGETSEATCGFVVEFADIITESVFINSTVNDGGYPSSAVYSTLNTTIYNSLPEDLKSVMKNTTVIAGHGRNTVNPLNLERDSNNNYILRNQKLYLLSEKEVIGSSGSDSAANTTRQLKFYQDGGNQVKKLNNNPREWWLHSVHSGGDEMIVVISAGGGSQFSRPYNSCGISPAFRIGE